MNINKEDIMDRRFVLMLVIWIIYLGFLLPFYLDNEKRTGPVEAVWYK